MKEPVKKSDNTSNRYMLAIDLGTSSLKAALVSETGEVLAGASEIIDTMLLPGEGAEQDPEQWWEASMRASKKVIADAGIPPEMIIGVCCDSQWSVIVPVDENLKPLMRAVHWLDRRGGPYARAMVKGYPKVQGYGLFKLLTWIKLTGLAPSLAGLDSLGKILFIKNEFPEIYTKTHKFLEPMDFLTARLSGRITATQQTVLSYMLASNRKWGLREYSNKLINLTGIDREKLPELITNNGVIGPILPAVAGELGLSPSTPVIAGINDNQSSAIGAGVVKDYEGLVYVGTSLHMISHVPFKKTDINHMIASFPSCLENRYAMLCEQGLGGKCMEFFLKNIVYSQDDFNSEALPEDAFERLNNIAGDIPPGSGNVLFLPWLSGVLAPQDCGTARGGFFNLSLTSTRSHLARAVMEGVAFNSRWAMTPVEKFIGKKFEKLRYSGGGALSSVWCQIYADIMGVPIHQVADPIHTASRGAALNGFVALGHQSLEKIPELVKIKEVFEPDGSNTDLYDKMFKQFVKLFEKNKKVFKVLNTN